MQEYKINMSDSKHSECVPVPTENSVIDDLIGQLYGKLISLEMLKERVAASVRRLDCFAFNDIKEEVADCKEVGPSGQLRRLGLNIIKLDDINSQLATALNKLENYI